MFHKIKHLLLIPALIAGLYACVKKKTYSQKPEIEFKEFIPYADESGDMIITFSDGDGDLGKTQDDQTFNLFSTYYYFNPDSNRFMAWYNALTLDTVRTPYRIRKPIDDYNGKPISGEVKVEMNLYRVDPSHKRIKYVMYMIDNANNVSNVLTTPELQVP